MLRWLRQNRLVFIDDCDKWRKLLKEVYAELDAVRRERNALKDYGNFYLIEEE